ncbi:DHB2 dehydrogenase, partial [Atractosteus spatula]|nr:DHB2 dehydrogenase [Atractosteus spatula]
MAGKLKPDEMRDVISRLNAISNSLESAVATLLQSQEDLKKANETQTYLNQVPGYAGLLLLSLLYYISLSLLGKSQKLLPVNNKSVLITGCDSGFGHALAKHLDSLGLTVFAGVLNEQSPGSDELRRCSSKRLLVLQLDVTNSAQIRKAYQQIKAEVGETGLWAIVNNAGILGYLADGEILPMTVFKKCMAVNFLGAVELSQTFLPLLRRARGRMVNVSSMAAKVPVPMFSAYCASKAALSMFSEVMRQELSRWGVRVSVIQPGGFRTNIFGTREEWSSYHEEILSQVPQDVKEDYGEEYISSFQKRLPKMSAASSVDLQPVLHNICHALLAVRPQHVYAPGRLACIIPFVHSFFPAGVFDLLVGVLFTFHKNAPARLQRSTGSAKGEQEHN